MNCLEVKEKSRFLTRLRQTNMAYYSFRDNKIKYTIEIPYFVKHNEDRSN